MDQSKKLISVMSFSFLNTFKTFPYIQAQLYANIILTLN